LKQLSDIDKLIKEGLDGFMPEPPADIWQGIQDKISVNAPSDGGTSSQVVDSGSKLLKMFSAIKNASVLVKVASLGLTAFVTAGIIYFSVDTHQIPVTEVVKNTIVASDSDINEKAASTIETVEIIKNQERTSVPVKKIHSDKVDSKLDRENSVKDDNKNEDPIQEKSKVDSKDSNLDKVQTKNLTENGEKTIGKNQSNDDKPSIEEPLSNYKTETPVVNNFISPNGDGANDVLKIQIENESYYHFVVFDLKNNKQFESFDKNNEWNGSHYQSGVECPSGQYQYLFEYQLKGSNNVEVLRGFIRLVR